MKAKKLKNILLATTFGLSFGFSNPAKGQKPTIDQPIEKHYYEDSKYILGDKIEVWEYSEKINGQEMKVVHKYNPRTNSESVVSNIKSQTTQNNKPGNNLSKTTQEEWEKAYEKNASRNSNTQNKPTPNTPSNYNYPRYNNASKKSKTNFGDVLNTTNNVLNLTNTLIEIFKPQPTYIYPAQPINKSPSEIYNESKKSENLEWDWQTNKSKDVKSADGNFWEDNAKKTESKNPEGNFWEDKPSKELSDLVKENKYSPETKKKLEEEAKISDEYFKEIGMNPGAQVKYKVVGTAEIGLNGELIKKDSYSPARELTDEEKVILYYAYNLSKNYTQAEPIIKGVETINKLEKDVDFLFAKPIGDNTYSYFKLAGKEDYFVMKDSPSGNAIMNVANFKEKTEKAGNFWED